MCATPRNFPSWYWIFFFFLQKTDWKSFLPIAFHLNVQFDVFIFEHDSCDGKNVIRKWENIFHKSCLIGNVVPVYTIDMWNGKFKSEAKTWLETQTMTTYYSAINVKRMHARKPNVDLVLHNFVWKFYILVQRKSKFLSQISWKGNCFLNILPANVPWPFVILQFLWSLFVKRHTSIACWWLVLTIFVVKQVSLSNCTTYCFYIAWVRFQYKLKNKYTWKSLNLIPRYWCWVRKVFQSNYFSAKWLKSSKYLT